MKQEQAIRRLTKLAEEWGCGVKPQEPMKHHVTMRVGGPADLLLEVPTEQALRQVLLFCRAEEVPYYVVGRGSNLLVSDDGVQGVVLLLDRRPAQKSAGKKTTLSAGPGLRLLRFVPLPGNTGSVGWSSPGAFGQCRRGRVYERRGL